MIVNMKYLQKRAIARPLLGQFNRSICYRRTVVIPALAEAETLPLTLQSLYVSKPPDILAETLILIVVNNRAPENDISEGNSEIEEYLRSNLQTLRWLKDHTPTVPSQIAWIDSSSPGFELPSWGGVGLARKIGCDSILAFLRETENPTPLSKFVFFSLDADTLVSPNYLKTAAHELLESGKAGGVIPFKHQQAASPEGQAAIDAYEAFLSYYVGGLRWARSPYAFHSVGSCLCFTARGYIQANGFPARRRAGEDFYFSMELAKTGGIYEIQHTSVFPSSRISRRVPFGTGRRMAEALLMGKKDVMVYDPRVFVTLRKLLFAISTNLDGEAEEIYACINHPQTADFLERRGFSNIWTRFRQQYKGEKALLAAFHRWFDGFVTLKYIHWLTEHMWPRQRLESTLGTDLPWSKSL
jgi:hypothetical protein